jgi:fructose-1,6-bisphosphatase/inositol monophosphatase family enzyme
VATEVLLPRFHLAESDVTEKAPGEIVTTADRAAEQMLTTRLTELLAGSMVVGEESVAETPALLDLLATDGQVWPIDPLDGTANFAAGHGPFGIMVALLRGGETVATWLLDPLGGTCVLAEAGGGAFVNEVRVRSLQNDPGPLRGAIFTRFLPPDLRAWIASRSGSFCAGAAGLLLRGVRVPGDRPRAAALHRCPGTSQAPDAVARVLWR